MVHLIFNEKRLTAALLSALGDNDLIVLNLGVQVPKEHLKCPAVTLGEVEGLAGIDGKALYALVKEHGGKVKSYF